MNDPLESRRNPRIEDVFTLLERAGYTTGSTDLEVEVEGALDSARQSSTRRDSDLSTYESRHCWRPDPVANCRVEGRDGGGDSGGGGVGSGYGSRSNANDCSDAAPRRPNLRIAVAVLLGSLFAFTFVRVAVAFVFNQMGHTMFSLSHGLNSSIISIVIGVSGMMTLVVSVVADGWLGREPTLFWVSVLRVGVCLAVLLALAFGGGQGNNVALEATAWIAQFVCNGETGILEALIRDQFELAGYKSGSVSWSTWVLIWTVATYAANATLFALVSSDDQLTDSQTHWNATVFMSAASAMAIAASVALASLRYSVPGAALAAPPNKSRMKSILGILCCCYCGSSECDGSDAVTSGEKPAEMTFPVASGSCKSGDNRDRQAQLSNSQRPVLAYEAGGVSSTSWLSNSVTEAALSAAATIRRQDVVDFRRVSTVMVVASLGEGMVMGIQGTVWSATVHGLTLWTDEQGRKLPSLWNYFFSQTANLVFYISFLVALHYIGVRFVLSPFRKVTFALVPACIGVVAAFIIEYFRQQTPLVFPAGNNTIEANGLTVESYDSPPTLMLTSDYNGGCDTSRQREMSMMWSLFPLALFALAYCLHFTALMEYIWLNTPKQLRAVAFGLYIFFISFAYTLFGLILGVLELADICSMERSATGPVRELIYLGVAAVQVVLFFVLLFMTSWARKAREKSCKIRRVAFDVLKRAVSEVAV